MNSELFVSNLFLWTYWKLFESGSFSTEVPDDSCNSSPTSESSYLTHSTYCQTSESGPLVFLSDPLNLQFPISEDGPLVVLSRRIRLITDLWIWTSYSTSSIHFCSTYCQPLNLDPLCTYLLSWLPVSDLDSLYFTTPIRWLAWQILSSIYGFLVGLRQLIASFQVCSLAVRPL